MFLLEIHRNGEFLDHVGWFASKDLALAMAAQLHEQHDVVLVYPDGQPETLSRALPARAGNVSLAH